MTNHRRRWWLALAALAVVAAVAAALAASAGPVSAARSGTMAPASGPATLYRSIGQPLAGPNGIVHFGCQKTVPAGCYGPDQIRAAYGIQPLLDEGYDGAGRTIAIIDAYGSPTIDNDLGTFDALWSLPAPPSFHTVAPFGIESTDPDNAAGWAGETSLDVEWAHAVAPAANILLVVAKSNNDSDILDATQWVLDHDAGDVISQSYGEAEKCMDPVQLARQHQIFRNLTAKGVTIFASSGDQGAGIYTCDGNAFFKATSTPASDPYVTSVGGTALHADGVSGAYQSESTWNESELLGAPWASGGGISVIYSRPSYQAPVWKDAMRAVPDVAYNAAIFNGVIAVWDGGFYRFGGTSAGSPQWAGLAAIAGQIAGRRVGPINTSLYDVGKNAKSATYFHDVADGSSNSIPDFGAGTGTPISGFAAVPGYDLATGLGTPIANTLLPYLAKHANRDVNNGSVASTIGGANGKHGHKRPH